MSGGAGAPLRVLCVEPDPDNREVIRRTLEGAGTYEVHEASDGVSGLERARELHPAVVLTDVRLPLLDGFGLLRRLRETPELEATPVVAVTASVMKGERRRCLEAGFAAFVDKPFDIHALRQTVADCLDRPTTRRADPVSRGGSATADRRP